MASATREDFLAFRREVRRKLKDFEAKLEDQKKNTNKKGCRICGSKQIYVKKQGVCRKHYYQEYRQKKIITNKIRTCTDPLCNITFKSREERLCKKCERREAFGSK